MVDVVDGFEVVDVFECFVTGSLAGLLAGGEADLVVLWLEKSAPGKLVRCRYGRR